MTDEKPEFSEGELRAIRIVDLAAKWACLGGWTLGGGSIVVGMATGNTPVTVFVGAGIGGISLLFIEVTASILRASDYPKKPTYVSKPKASTTRHNRLP